MANVCSACWQGHQEVEKENLVNVFSFSNSLCFHWGTCFFQVDNVLLSLCINNSKWSKSRSLMIHCGWGGIEMAAEECAASNCIQVTQVPTCSWNRCGELSVQGTKYQEAVEVIEILRTCAVAGEQNSSRGTSGVQSFKTWSGHDSSATLFVYEWCYLRDFSWSGIPTQEGQPGTHQNPGERS